MAVREKNLIRALQELPGADAVLFDMDGLIFDTERLFMEQLAVVMRDYGYRLTREIYCGSLGLGGRQLREYMAAQFGTEYPFDEITQITKRKVEAVAETVGLIVKPDIRETLAWLKEQEVYCAVASSTHTERVEYYLRQAGLSDWFSLVVGGEQVQRSKPYPDIFLHTCRLAKKKPERCIVLEDSENGVIAAYRSGCRVVCVPDLKMPSEEVMQFVDVLVQRI
ncbi:MAG: HAD family phosphatase [Clostridiaceae bacterium]|nr:HAD family phosphatase [Clostridiaceae bacterium]